MTTREIKFRGKRIDKPNEWVYGDYHYDKVIKKIYIIDDLNNMCRVIPETVGQFTNRHDKNKQEIYEGDILKAKGFVDAKYYIRWGDNNGSWFPEILNPEYRCTYGTTWKDQICHDEKIGNKFDNPELMK